MSLTASTGTRPGIYPQFAGTLSKHWSPLSMIDTLLAVPAVRADPERVRQLRIARTAYSNARRA